MSSDTGELRNEVEYPKQHQSALSSWSPAIAVSLSTCIAVIDSVLMNVAVPAIVADLETPRRAGRENSLPILDAGGRDRAPDVLRARGHLRRERPGWSLVRC